jgi:flagellar basal body-associated protein FliL
MADEEIEKNEEEPKEQENSKAGLLHWIIMAAVVLICAGSGFLLGRLFTGSPVTGIAEASQENQTAREPDLLVDDSAPDSTQTWFYDLAPVISNLDEPGATRYVRAILTLEVTSSVSQKEATRLFQEKAPILTDWLTIFLASLSIEIPEETKNSNGVNHKYLMPLTKSFFPIRSRRSSTSSLRNLPYNE